MKNPLLLCAALATLAGCTWVKLEDAGAHVRVAYDGRVDGCDKVGEVGVSVKDRIGPYDRSNLKVKDELETLARNQAASLPADTLVALGEPRNGEQSFAAYHCGNARPARAARAPAQPAPARTKGEEAQTFPVR
jgi:hypothetical protein